MAPDDLSRGFDHDTQRLSRRTLAVRAATLGMATPWLASILTEPTMAQEDPATGGAEGRVGPAADRLIFSSFNVDQAPLEIRNDRMDLYLYGLKTAGARDVAETPEGVRLIQAPASTLSIVLNPAPPREGELNPFALKPIRQAMQFLIDRDFIANDIYQGNALPMLSHVSPLDYDELTVFDTLRQADIRHDPEFARTTIAAEMTAAGASQENGVWAFQGRPAAIKMVIRVEDERRDIGDLIRAALESAGFLVQPVYQPFGPATLAVYASDPLTFQWHVYTEGWGRSSADRYDFGTINQMYAPWLGNMPGWLETGFWQYEQPELDAIGQRLYRGEFVSKDERDDLYRQMTGMGIDESVRLWLATAIQNFPVRDAVENLTEDVVGGPKSPLSLREATVAGSPELRVGHLWVWTDRTTWNPVGGFGDVYSSDIYKNLVDPPILSHPFTGLPIAFRADFAVETAGPEGTLPVPEDAVLWDAAGDRWVPVGAGIEAVSKVVYDYARYFGTPFHHRQPISPADLVYSIAQAFELAYDGEKLQIETALGVTARPFLDTFRGFKLNSDDTLEVYVDFWHFEEAYIASYASAGGLSTPWEMLFAMDDVVFGQRRAAYSDTAAARFGVPWLSLVTESDARLVERTLRGFASDRVVPPGVFEMAGRTLVSPDDAVARYEAARAWFDDTGMLVVSNGPFVLSRYDPPAQFAELQAFREEGYPFKPGDWSFGPPPGLTVRAEPPVALLGEPLSLPVSVDGPGTLALRYALVDPAAAADGRLVASGEATGEAGQFNVSIGPDVTAVMFPGIYHLYLLASSDEIARVAERRLDVEIGV
ncbi:MAG TPA: ABC transporter substrate-binding protein [Thermomicrobiales bacterium]|nr:ABC transporter substrate-binding protein [Thermomicrobiales bacterium]